MGVERVAGAQFAGVVADDAVEKGGGIRAFVDDQEPLSPGDFIGRWMSQIAPAADSIAPEIKRDREAYLHRLEFASVELSLRNLMTFPCVNILTGRGKIKLHGAYFGVAEGSLMVLDQTAKEFHSVREDQVAGG